MLQRIRLALPWGKALAWAALLALILGAGLGVNPAAAAATPGQLEDAARYAPGEILVGYLPDRVDPAALLAGFWPAQDGALQAQAVDFYPLPGLHFSRSDLAKEAVVQGVHLQVPVGEERDAIAYLREQPGILLAEPNWIVRASQEPVVPTDILYRSEQWGMQRIGMSRAWAITTGTRLQVAVIDSGVDLRHPEFRGRLLTGKNYLEPLNPPQDDNGHGTHVAGIVAATLNNGAGMAGVAPQVWIDPRKILDRDGRGTIVKLGDAIREASIFGSRIINLSLEVDCDQNECAWLAQAVDFAASRGTLLVGSSGNTRRSNVLWPAAYAGVMAVGASLQDDSWASYSNYGPEIELVAPGGLVQTQPPVRQLIASAWPGGVPCLTGLPSGYCGLTGTSMSAAYVSGAAALVWSLRPDLSAAGVRELLRSTAVPLTEDPLKVGQGRLDVAAALEQALAPALSVATTPVTVVARAGMTATHTVVRAITNPSRRPLSWTATITPSAAWLQVASAQPGSVSRYQPGDLTLQLPITGGMTGTHTGAVQVVGIPPTGAPVTRTLPVELRLVAALAPTWLPAVQTQSAGLYRSFLWAIPNAAGKQGYILTDESSRAVSLPFTVTVDTVVATTARIHANGFVALPANSTTAGTRPNLCLANQTWPELGIFGWWTDLDPGQGGAVTTFTDRVSGAFVIEYDRVPIAGGDRRISFQIVLHPNGTLGLNYGAVPADAGSATVGVSVANGLRFLELGCVTATEERGRLPRSGQSLLVTGAHLY